MVKFEMIGHPSVVLGGKEIVAPMNGGNLIQRLQLLPSRFHLLLGFGQLVILRSKNDEDMSVKDSAGDAAP